MKLSLSCDLATSILEKIKKENIINDNYIKTGLKKLASHKVRRLPSGKFWLFMLQMKRRYITVFAL